jgi:hypothetical protein
MEWLQKNKYFHVVVKGVERDGWKFVLLARFHHYHPTSLTMLFQPQMFDFSEIFSFPQLLAAYQ